MLGFFKSRAPAASAVKTLTPHDVHEAKRWLDSLPVAALSS